MPFVIPCVVFAQPTLTVLHPQENASLPPINEVFVYGAVTPGAALTVNGATIPVHAEGGYLAMVPIRPGAMVLTFEAVISSSESIRVERKFNVTEPFVPLPAKPPKIVDNSIEPKEDMLLAPGDWLRIAFQGSPGGTAEFAFKDAARRVPMAEISLSTPIPSVDGSTVASKGLYEGAYWIQPGDAGERLPVEVFLKKDGKNLKEKAKGRVTIDPGNVPKTGVILDEQVAVRTGQGGGYDMFLYKGMRTRLLSKVAGERRIALSSMQGGWIKESAVQELPSGLSAPRSPVNNIGVVFDRDSTLIRVPLLDVLPFRTEQSLDPMQLVVTLYGAVVKTDFIRYDPLDPLIRIIRWRQIAPDVAQLIIEPKFDQWWGYDVRYEGNALVIEVRKPWMGKDVRGMVIAVDAGHGGSEKGAYGNHETMEKDANLAIARKVVEVLADAGAKPFLTRDRDADLPLYERPKLAWSRRAHLFVSVHCNSAGVTENPTVTNGYSVYFYHPQSMALAQAVHSHYGKKTLLPDRGLFYADFAVCRMTQMPAILTENAYMIVPEQEQLLFDPKFHKACANAILGGIRELLGK